MAPKEQHRFFEDSDDSDVEDKQQQQRAVPAPSAYDTGKSNKPTSAASSTTTTSNGKRTKASVASSPGKSKGEKHGASPEKAGVNGLASPSTTSASAPASPAAKAGKKPKKRRLTTENGWTESVPASTSASTASTSTATAAPTPTPAADGTDAATAPTSKKKKRKLSNGAATVNGVVTLAYSSDEEDEGVSQQQNGAGTRARPSTQQGPRKNKADLLARRHELLQQRQDLPVYACRERLVEEIRKHDTVVILGATGSGKTTQVPQFLLDSTVPCERPRIACTQPRRVAATSLASRVAEEVGVHLGGLVGYTVRFDDRTTDRKTRLTYLTDGSLLANMLADRDLNNLDVVILDEAHERALRTDLLIGFLKQIQARRKERVKAWRKSGGKDEPAPTELKIVVMSATLDAERFSSFYGDAPILFVEGRQHPVAIMHAEQAPTDFIDGVTKTVYDIHTRLPDGDILVFLPGQEDIEGAAASIRSYEPDLPAWGRAHGRKVKQIKVCPLYAKLSFDEQQAAFNKAPADTRKVVLATNVAETSVTIPGVVYVIDTGLCKEKRFRPESGVDELLVRPISQAAAQQRTGRAGRERSGTCFRLYPREAYNRLEKATMPEIRRVSLASAVLQMLANGVDDVFAFDLLDKPEQAAMSSALMELMGLGAVAGKQGLGTMAITPLGLQMASLPLEPTLARVLLEATHEGCTRDVIDLVSLMGNRDGVFVSSAASQDEARAAHARFTHREGDHLMLLSVLRAFDDVPQQERREWCRANYIGMRALLNVAESRRQLRERLQRLGIDPDVGVASAGDDGSGDASILRACLTGLFANVATLTPDGNSYAHRMTRQPVAIHPSSCLHGKRHAAIMYDELVLTSRTYARTCSVVDVRWLQEKVPQIYSAQVQAASEK